MHARALLRAPTTVVLSRGLARKKAPTLVYPTLALYRKILRAHEVHLPASHRELGDAYVRDEFRAHRGASVSARAAQPRTAQ